MGDLPAADVDLRFLLWDDQIRILRRESQKWHRMVAATLNSSTSSPAKQLIAGMAVLCGSIARNNVSSSETEVCMTHMQRLLEDLEKKFDYSIRDIILVSFAKFVLAFFSCVLVKGPNLKSRLAALRNNPETMEYGRLVMFICSSRQRSDDQLIHRITACLFESAQMSPFDKRINLNSVIALLHEQVRAEHPTLFAFARLFIVACDVALMESPIIRTSKTSAVASGRLTKSTSSAQPKVKEEMDDVPLASTAITPSALEIKMDDDHVKFEPDCETDDTSWNNTAGILYQGEPVVVGETQDESGGEEQLLDDVMEGETSCSAAFFSRVTLRKDTLDMTKEEAGHGQERVYQRDDENGSGNCSFETSDESKDMPLLRNRTFPLSQPPRTASCNPLNGYTPGPSRLPSSTIRSIRGMKLLYDDEGYEYRRSHVNREGQQLWRCNTRKCKGKAKEEEGSVVVYAEHFPRHLPPDFSQEIRMVKTSAKAQRLQGASVAQVVSRHVHQAADHLKPFLNASALKRTIRRASNTLARDWPAPIDENKFDEVFLRVDNCASYQQGDPRALKIFATAHGVQILNANLDWFADATFREAPYGFSQVLVIGVKDAHIFTPCLYAFLSDKSAIAYTAVYKWMNQAGIAQPLTCQQDFEPELIIALHAVFPRVSIQLCAFHFFNSVYQHIQKCSLITMYRDPAKKWCLKGCMALALIDPAEVYDYFEALSEEGLASVPTASHADLSKFYDYFETTYLGKTVNGNRSQPTYGVDQWNVYSRVLNNQQIGTSIQEGYNPSLKLVTASSSAQFVAAQLFGHQKDYETKRTSAALRNMTIDQLYPQSLCVAAEHRRRKQAVGNGRRAGHSAIDHLNVLSTYIKVEV